MEIWGRVLHLIGFRSFTEASGLESEFCTLMQQRLMRVRLAEQQIQEARSLEELDIGRSALSAAWAEIQQIIRLAKQERGITLRPISETEKMHRRLIHFMHRRTAARKSVAYPQSSS